MDKADAGIIIVTPETGELLDRCLKSLARQTVMPREVIVMLNGCGGMEKLCDQWRNILPIKVIALDVNVGFAKAALEALPQITSRWVGVINADAVAEADWLEEMIKAGERSLDIGSVASAELYADDPTRVQCLGLEVGASGTTYGVGIGKPYREEPVREVFAATGGAALFRREAVEQVGFFDRIFFLYYEDVDLAWRLRGAGWRVVAASRARVHHKGSAFVKHAPKTYHLQKNKLAVIIRNWPASAILRNFSYILFLDVASVFISSYRERSLNSLKARISFILELPILFLERKKILRGRVPGAENWIFDDRAKALKRLKWKFR